MKKTTCSGLLLLFVGILLLMSQPILAGVSNEVCAGCHDEVSEMFSNTSHGIYFSSKSHLQDASCESCHGSAIDHIEDGDPDLIINPANSGQFGAKELCLMCHKSHKFNNWKFSSHGTADLTCADCHPVHMSYEKSSVNSSSENCLKCHADVRSSLSMPSHHPIGEGKLECIDCHGVHGEPARMTMNNNGAELCFSCHAEKEGPFVYEHSPVQEDCMMCHTPHGSVADNLLIKSEPSLCLSCHPMHFHSAAVAVDGEFAPRHAPERGGISESNSMERGFNTKCTQCHSEIHGSDLPSQTITTGGNALTR